MNGRLVILCRIATTQVGNLPTVGVLRRDYVTDVVWVAAAAVEAVEKVVARGLTTKPTSNQRAMPT